MADKSLNYFWFSLAVRVSGVFYSNMQSRALIICQKKSVGVKTELRYAGFSQND